MESIFLIGCTMVAAAGAVGVKVFMNSVKLNKLKKKLSKLNEGSNEAEIEKEIDKIVKATGH